MNVTDHEVPDGKPDSVKVTAGFATKVIDCDSESPGATYIVPDDVLGTYVVPPEVTEEVLQA